jgi:hypothetical protein
VGASGEDAPGTRVPPVAPGSSAAGPGARVTVHLPAPSARRPRRRDALCTRPSHVVDRAACQTGGSGGARPGPRGARGGGRGGRRCVRGVAGRPSTVLLRGAVTARPPAWDRVSATPRRRRRRFRHDRGDPSPERPAPRRAEGCRRRACPARGAVPGPGVGPGRRTGARGERGGRAGARSVTVRMIGGRPERRAPGSGARWCEQTTDGLAGTARHTEVA